MDADAKNSNCSRYSVEAVTADQTEVPLYLKIAEKVEHRLKPGDRSLPG